MRRADRLFQLVQILRNRRFATAEQLADELRVSARTIYRDVRDLQLSGVPLLGEAGVGYHLQRGFELPPLTFNAAELEALALGARVVETWGDDELGSAARSAITKIEAVLPEALKRLLTGALLFAPKGPRARAVGSEELGVLRRAVVEQRKVRFAYIRADYEESERVVRPLGLHFWGAKWSLAAWCELRQDYRSFRVDRMHALSVLDERFDGADGITLSACIDVMEAQARADGWADLITGVGPDG